MILKLGAIYALRYSQWKKNYKIYAFIMWPGGGVTKTHLLNLGAIQLSIIDRAKIVRTIVRLTNAPSASKFNGRLLYQIFKTYIPQQIKKCYRTFFIHYITHAALINYGLNKEEDFSELELSGQSKDLYAQAQRDYIVKAMNLYSRRGAQMKEVEKTLATPGEESKIDETTTDGPSINKPGVEPKTPDDGDEFGY